MSSTETPATVETSHRNDFDLVSPIYDLLAWLVYGNDLRKAQLSLLPEVADIQTALVVGGGTGWFLLELLKQTRVRRVTYVELSTKMMAKSKELIATQHPEWLDRVDFRLGTQDSLTAADGPFDLIVTNFFLDVFNDENCARSAATLHRHLASDGRWLFVDFVMPERGWPRWYARPLFKVMFTFFNVMSDLEARRPPDFDTAFARIGMRTYIERTFHATLVRARLLRHA